MLLRTDISVFLGVSGHIRYSQTRVLSHDVTRARVITSGPFVVSLSLSCAAATFYPRLTPPLSPLPWPGLSAAAIFIRHGPTSSELGDRDSPDTESD